MLFTFVNHKHSFSKYSIILLCLKNVKILIELFIKYFFCLIHFKYIIYLFNEKYYILNIMKIIRISELKKMKKNNKLMIIFLLFSISNNLTFCLESTDYCSLKYREQKCHGSFSYRCDSIQLICSKGIKQCIDYKQKNTYIKLMYEYQKTNPLNKHVQERVTFKLFNKDIKHCKFKFKADDLCLNKKNCTEKKLKPTEFGFKCGSFRRV